MPWSVEFDATGFFDPRASEEIFAAGDTDVILYTPTNCLATGRATLKDGGGSAIVGPVVAETDAGTILATLEQTRPEVCVVDSVQTLHSAELAGAAGSVAGGRVPTARTDRGGVDGQREQRS